MKIVSAFMAFFLCLMGQPAAAATGAQPVVDAPTLSVLITLPNMQVVDIRSPEEYAKAHLPGAVSAPYGKWRGPAHSPGQLADAAYLEQLAQQLGLEVEQHIIVYSSGDSQTDFGAAARVYWTLKYMGFTHLSLLNGGYQQWQKEQLPVDAVSPTVTPSTFKIQLNPSIVIFKDELLEKVQSKDAQTQILDARPQAFYEGKVKAPTASTTGTIAGAKNTQHQQWFSDESATLIATDKIKELVRTQGLDQVSETVSFCNTGHWAATNWFVLSEVAGLANVRMYPASLAEWTQSEQALPMDNVPTRLEQVRTRFEQLIKK